MSDKLRHYTSAERKAMPVHTLMAYYFPDALAAVARHALKANEKHNPGERMRWAREKSKDHLECAARHLLTPDMPDPDTGEIELVCATWRLMAAVQLREEARLVAAGIMPLSGVVPAAPVAQDTKELKREGCVCGRGHITSRHCPPVLSPEARYDS